MRNVCQMKTDFVEISGNNNLDFQILGASVRMINSSIINNTLVAAGDGVPSIEFDSLAMIGCHVNYNTYIISEQFYSNLFSDSMLFSLFHANFDFCMYGTWMSYNSLQDLRTTTEEDHETQQEQWNLLNVQNINCDRVWEFYINFNQDILSSENYTVVNTFAFNRNWNSLVGITFASTSLRFWAFQDNELRQLHSNPSEMAEHGPALIQILRWQQFAGGNFTTDTYVGDVMLDWSNDDMASQTYTLIFFF
ncbi:hypothetical protein RFI_13924 [Reticulomyxa filosa]|uniref:Uncharacterized protein n=1 Tax=Reticulomyxa filosa TaxID=46433 RepID=X6NAD2_RETFI|nr:hypothetical protein RFI_13924 [Reticulomyxa filosa]|eukprot:ETO23255.1 hypothetical protein RFI_13924 [Reticulomyxa filosa]